MKGSNTSSFKNPQVPNKSVEEPAPLVNIINKSDQEFLNLIEQEQQNHKTKTVKLLNEIFNNDPSSKEVIILVKNNSDCNLVLKIIGTNNYSLPIYGHNENFLVINKGNYHITSDICNAKFERIKNIDKSFVLTISNPIAKNTGSKISNTAVLEK